MVSRICEEMASAFPDSFCQSASDGMTEVSHFVGFRRFVVRTIIALLPSDNFANKARQSDGD